MSHWFQTDVIPWPRFYASTFYSSLTKHGISHLWWAIALCARNESPAGQMQKLKQTNTQAINWSSAVYVWLLVATNPQNSVSMVHLCFFAVLHPKVAFLFRQERKQENKAPKSVEDHPRPSTAGRYSWWVKQLEETDISQERAEERAEGYY